jgi:hypothetical protein
MVVLGLCFFAFLMVRTLVKYYDPFPVHHWHRYGTDPLYRR